MREGGREGERNGERERDSYIELSWRREVVEV